MSVLTVPYELQKFIKQIVYFAEDRDFTLVEAMQYINDNYDAFDTDPDLQEAYEMCYELFEGVKQ